MGLGESVRRVLGIVFGYGVFLGIMRVCKMVIKGGGGCFVWFGFCVGIGLVFGYWFFMVWSWF